MNYTIYIIGICIVMFIFELFFNSLVPILSFNPANALNMPWQFITAMFIHANFMHLFANMFVLFFFGIKLERLIGGANFIKVFFISGIVGNIAYLLYSDYTNTYIPALGASGAISGVLGTLTILEPNMKIVMFPLPIPIKLKTATMVFAIFEIICVLFSILPSIGHICHLGGLFTGIFFGKMFKKNTYKSNIYFY
ncbi:rhomboid family intramembrane serine protease [Methanothermococcus sp.]|uniref:rhomboid family intramembrane serine protease n=1 Tax=Methanothermococcus sp. TaxID=2614238 RepID=UPI0025DA5CF5|nr:rhomboid family intramembrane serine protease [Methanothermococcus sp.]